MQYDREINKLDGRKLKFIGNPTAGFTILLENKHIGCLTQNEETNPWILTIDGDYIENPNEKELHRLLFVKYNNAMIHTHEILGIPVEN